MSESYHPIVLLPIISFIFGLILAVLAFRKGRLLSRVFLGFGALVLFLPAAWLFLAFHPELVDERIRAYKDFFSHVSIGMTRDDLSALVERDYPKDGPRQRPKIVEEASDHVSFCMSPERERDPNCEGITVKLQDGRVSGKAYVRD